MAICSSQEKGQHMAAPRVLLLCRIINGKWYKAYNDYEIEDVLVETADIHLSPIRKQKSTRAVPPYITYVQHYHRKMIETVCSLIERMLPKTIHAVTAEGFELKVFLFVLAYSLNCL